MAKHLKYTLFLFLSLFLFLIRPADCFCRDISPKDSLLREIVAGHGQARVTVPFSGKTEIQYFSRNVSVSSVKDEKMEIVISPLTLDWFISQKTAYEILSLPDARFFRTSSCTGQALEWESYPTYPQYDSIMHAFSARYPFLCSIDTIGTSIRGRLVLVLRISAADPAAEARPGVFFTSTI
ncbi:MAG: hypothetical protein GX876_02825, partial [Bacteroidales bacterium]|nr:hypothetical protein [Bacteroidales bacterium]